MLGQEVMVGDDHAINLLPHPLTGSKERAFALVPAGIRITGVNIDSLPLLVRQSPRRVLRTVARCSFSGPTQEFLAAAPIQEPQICVVKPLQANRVPLPFEDRYLC
jgi:hypothetical protein